MSAANKLGLNRTGIDMSPVDSKTMIEGAAKLTQFSPQSQQQIAAFREMAIAESGMVGSVPLPGSFKGALNVGKEKLRGHNPEVLINKLGQRLAFERAGVRLYDALIRKCATLMDSETAQIVSMDTLHQFREEEREHAFILETVIKEIGADPTAMTPDADVSAVAAMGLPKVMTEPRTSVLQWLEALQIAELADNAAWENLQMLCLNMGLNDIASGFGKALSQEKVHEEVVSDWIRRMMLYSADS